MNEIEEGILYKYLNILNTEYSFAKKEKISDEIVHRYTKLTGGYIDLCSFDKKLYIKISFCNFGNIGIYKWPKTEKYFVNIMVNMWDSSKKIRTVMNIIDREITIADRYNLK